MNSVTSGHVKMCRCRRAVAVTQVRFGATTKSRNLMMKEGISLQSLQARLALRIPRSDPQLPGAQHSVSAASSATEPEET